MPFLFTWVDLLIFRGLTPLVVVEVLGWSEEELKIFLASNRQVAQDTSNFYCFDEIIINGQSTIRAK